MSELIKKVRIKEELERTRKDFFYYLGYACLMSLCAILLSYMGQLTDFLNGMLFSFFCFFGISIFYNIIKYEQLKDIVKNYGWDDENEEVKNK